MAEPGSPEAVAALDFSHRDPNNLNPDLKTLWEDVIGEPEGGHSAECVWRNSYKCYHIGKNCCYQCLTFVCAIPLAFCWGCEFACIMFSHIWHVTPCLRAFNMNFLCVARVWSTIVHCCYDPCYESCALALTRIHVHSVDQAPPYQSTDPAQVNLTVDGKN